MERRGGEVRGRTEMERRKERTEDKRGELREREEKYVRRKRCEEEGERGRRKFKGRRKEGKESW